MVLAPIALFVYNRLEHTRKTVEALQKNFLATDSDLIIFSDGFKDTLKNKESVIMVREYLKTVSGFKSIKIVERTENFGLAKSIITGIAEVVNQCGKVIVLEDDLITSQYFLKYMNEGLNLYENDKDVASIHGYIYPFKGILPETFFLKSFSCWGWGTWKRAWNFFEPDGKKLLNKLREQKLTIKFDLNFSYHFTLLLKEQIAGLNNSWAVRWYASMFLANKLGLYPQRSLVKNVGLDNSGIHAGSVKVFNVNLSDRPIEVKRIEIQENPDAVKVVEGYFKSPKNLFIFQVMRIKNELRLLFKSLFK